ncbi:MAG: VOC family protein [Bryobacterales bacterium]|nr:VOC family protein [Bryobacterales bacterium]
MKPRINRREFLVGAAALTGRAVAQDNDRPRITGVAGMHIRVSDMDRSLDHYCGWLGLGRAFEERVANGNRAVYLTLDPTHYIVLESGLDSKDDRFVAHALLTSDVDAAHLFFRKHNVAGLTVVGPHPTGARGFRFQNPDQQLVEMLEFRDDSRLFEGRPAPDCITTRFSHVGFLVGSLSRANAFYQELLGFREVWRGAGANAEHLAWVNMEVPNGQDYIEYMLYRTMPAPDRRGTVNHGCLWVDDLDASLRRLSAKHGSQRYERDLPVVYGRNDRRLCNLYDPDGTRVELMEPTTITGKPAANSMLPPPIA